MQGEITPAGVIILDSIFENRRDSVRVIRKQVGQYEKAVIGKAKRLEQARLKEQEAKSVIPRI
jgi:phosphoenolpyruvate synthase/pyruvate phosphate dikinase